MKLEIELFNKVIANKDYSENSKNIINKSVKYKRTQRINHTKGQETQRINHNTSQKCY